MYVIHTELIERSAATHAGGDDDDGDYDDDDATTATNDDDASHGGDPVKRRKAVARAAAALVETVPMDVRVVITDQADPISEQQCLGLEQLRETALRSVAPPGRTHRSRRGEGRRPPVLRRSPTGGGTAKRPGTSSGGGGGGGGGSVSGNQADDASEAGDTQTEGGDTEKADDNEGGGSETAAVAPYVPYVWGRQLFTLRTGSSGAFVMMERNQRVVPVGTSTELWKFAEGEEHEVLVLVVVKEEESAVPAE